MQTCLVSTNCRSQNRSSAFCIQKKRATFVRCHSAIAGFLLISVCESGRLLHRDTSYSIQTERVLFELRTLTTGTMAYVLSRCMSTCAVMRFCTDRYALLASLRVDDVARCLCRLPRRLTLSGSGCCCCCCCLGDDDNRFIWYSTMIWMRPRSSPSASSSTSRIHSNTSSILQNTFKH